MKYQPEFLEQAYDPRDPSPWLALYLDRSTPLDDEVKRAWLADSSSRSRQFVLPFMRPLARTLIVLIQVAKVFAPRRLAFSRTLHRLLAWGMENFLRPEANWLILRHFHLGSQVLEFIGKNSGVEVQGNPLRPAAVADVREDMFLVHDLNLFNFVIRLNQNLQAAGRELKFVADPDLSMIKQPELRLEDMPRRWRNFLDLQSSIELFTPIYQLLLTDSDFWRATNSLQLDETIGLYVATILDARSHLVLLNNRHPLVPLSTLRAGFRLTLHGLSTEMLHAFLMGKRDQQAAATAA
ncbi:hypothetical protein GLA29479_2182 [Lysobacter antibioticus]|uniref:Uncharacterized protein n=1 Tax=Lysobacter antibioticus TaxID=84531 RepID=A0A0S2DXA7_LYSAN|nr:hypothetical protein [Lysobacter antibioticus]ALN63052.1 hypothetical protein GLA29479_2182 [Lysobacter antibioticus]ALN79135.1 hypothetical protein LA76x_0974 [Lysobacter antibioticus]